MSRTIRLLAAITFVSLALESTLSAGPSSVKPPTSPKPPVMKPAKMATAPKPVKPAKAIAKPVRSAARADAGAGKHAAASRTATTPSTSTSAPTVVTSHPLAYKIAKNPNLAAKIQARLPAGMTLAQASTGFRNQGQFVAAVNVSNNLGIDFVKLQAAMTGQSATVDPATHAIISTPTGVAPLSLGQSIQQLRPGVDADAAAAKASYQTSMMVRTTTAAPASSKSTGGKSRH